MLLSSCACLSVSFELSLSSCAPEQKDYGIIDENKLVTRYDTHQLKFIESVEDEKDDQEKQANANGDGNEQVRPNSALVCPLAPSAPGPSSC